MIQTPERSFRSPDMRRPEGNGGARILDRARVALIAWCYLIASCGSEPNDGGSRTTEHVETESARLKSNAVESSDEKSDTTGYRVARFERDFYLDGNKLGFVSIHALAANDSMVAVLQRQMHGVRLFNLNGDSIDFIGGAGAGPGEFRLPAELGWIGDTLWIFDSTLNRMVLFHPGSSTTITRNLPPAVSWSSGASKHRYRVLSVREDGSLLALVYGMPQEIGSGRQEGRVLAHLNGAQILGVIARAPLLDAVAKQDGRTSVSVRPPFPNDVSIAVSRGGESVAIVSGVVSGPEAGSVRLVSLTPSGDTIYNGSISLPPAVIPRRVADDAIQQYINRAKNESDPLVAKATREAAQSPDVYPPATDVLLGSDKRLWMRDHARKRGYFVVGSDGALLGRVQVPGNVRIVAADASHFWTVEHDEFGVPSVARYSVSFQSR